MHRACCSLLLTGLVIGCAPAIDRPEPGRSPSLKAQDGSGRLAVLAGTSGVITTLAAYGDGTPHPGLNAIDIGAPSGAGVWHQVDYLPDTIPGGYLYVWQAHEAGRCSQWAADSPYYNGAKLYVQTHYLLDGAWRVHQAAYQHVEPQVALDTWISFNNAAAAERLFPDWAAEVWLGNTTEGGLWLGTVYPVARPIYNGPGGYLCTSGSHLHQEGQGQRASRRRVGERVTERYNDMHMFWP
jgi:hypothetical protein